MEKPLIMNNRKSYKRSSDKYLFISYSHKDTNVVYQILKQLYDRGINYWYDAQLNVGEKWNEQAEQALKDELCAGVLFFVSKSFFESEACNKEVDFVEHKIKENPEFKYFPVCVQDMGVYKILDKCNFEVQHHSLIDHHLQNLFHKDVIYLKNNETIIDDIYNELLKQLNCVINNQETALIRLINKKKIKHINGEYIFNFGSFPQNILGNIKMSPTDGDIYDFDDIRYRGLMKTYEFYRYTPLEFKIININDETIEAIPVNCLDITYGSKANIGEWLSTFKQLAFTNSENEIIQAIRNININDINYNKSLNQKSVIIPTKYAMQKNKLASTSFWVECENEYRLFSNNYTKLNAPINANMDIAGVVPVIILDLNQYLEK